jgi:hypothetical protein
MVQKIEEFFLVLATNFLRWWKGMANGGEFSKVECNIRVWNCERAEKGIAKNVFMCEFSFAKIGPLHHTSPIVDMEILKSRKSFDAN